MTFDISNATIVLPGATGPQRVGDMHLDLTLPSLSLSATEKGNAQRNIGESIGAKLRRLANNAAQKNPVVSDPYSIAPVWAASTAYVTGNIVSNGGNLYIATTAGTSAASGGPTGTAILPVTDGTVGWTFYGVSPITASSPFVPTVTAFNGSSPTGLANRYIVGTGATDNALRYLGGSIVSAGATDNSYKFGTTSLFGNQTGNAGAHSNGGTPSCMFETDAPKIAFGFAYPQNARIIVDGRYLFLGHTLYGTGGGECWGILDFSAVGGRKVRRFEVEFGGAAPFYGVCVDTASKVWKPDDGDNLRAITMGDSWIAGANNFPTMTGGHWPMLMGRLLGWDDNWLSGLGGTGYTTGGASSYPKPIERLTDMTANAPDVGLFSFGINDGGASAATITAAALAVFQAARSALPTTPLIVFGTPAQPGIGTALATTVENAVFAAVTTAADSNIWTVPVTTDPAGPWFTGTGKTTATSGSGNNDAYISSDGVHMVDGGYGYMARKSAAAIRKIVRQIP